MMQHEAPSGRALTGSGHVYVVQQCKQPARLAVSITWLPQLLFTEPTDSVRFSRAHSVLQK